MYLTREFRRIYQFLVKSFQNETCAEKIENSCSFTTGHICATNSRIRNASNSEKLPCRVMITIKKLIFNFRTKIIGLNQFQSLFMLQSSLKMNLFTRSVSNIWSLSFIFTFLHGLTNYDDHHFRRTLTTLFFRILPRSLKMMFLFTLMALIILSPTVVYKLRFQDGKNFAVFLPFVFVDCRR